MVEHTAENRGVAGSSPALATPVDPLPLSRDHRPACGRRGRDHPRAAAEGSKHEPEQESSRRRSRHLAAVVAVQAALAESPIVRFNAKDQSAARVAVLRAADIGTGWRAGSRRRRSSRLTPVRHLGAEAGRPRGHRPRRIEVPERRVHDPELGSAVRDRENARARLEAHRRSPRGSALRRQARRRGRWDHEADLVQAGSVPSAGAVSARFRLIVDQAVDGGGKVRMFMDVITVGRGRTASTPRSSAPTPRRRGPGLPKCAWRRSCWRGTPREADAGLATPC